jgi:hypothetical protein
MILSFGCGLAALSVLWFILGFLACARIHPRSAQYNRAREKQILISLMSALITQAFDRVDGSLIFSIHAAEVL